MNMEKPQNSFASIEHMLINGIASRIFMETVRIKLYDIIDSYETFELIQQNIQLEQSTLQSVLDFLEERGLIMNCNGFYSNSPQVAEFLVSKSPFYQGNILEMQEKMGNSACSAMRNLARKQMAENHESNDQEKGTSGNNSSFLLGPTQFAMRGTLQDAVAFIVALPQFKSAKTICDIGGNRGHYTTALLDRNPLLSGVIADRPNVAAIIEPDFQNSDYRDRISVLPFDLNQDTLPEQSYDLVLSSFVLHICAENLQAIIKKIADSLKVGGVFISQNMDPGLQYGDQKEKTVREVMTKMLGYPTHYLDQECLKDALHKAGFTDYKVQRTGVESVSYIISAVKQHG